MIELQAQEGRVHIRLRALFMGDDLCIIVDGGDKPHIGAVSLATGNTKTTPKTLCIPKHKDDVISEGVSQCIRNTLGLTTCCICGVHIGGITKDEIDIVLKLSHELATTLVQKLSKKQ